MDESRRLAMRRAHTKHQGFCSCGVIVCGNGGLFNHHEMHRRRGDGHSFLIEDTWKKRFTFDVKNPRIGIPREALTQAERGQQP